MTTLAVDGAEFPTRVVDWWGKGVFLFLCTSILLLCRPFRITALGWKIQRLECFPDDVFLLVNLEVSCLVSARAAKSWAKEGFLPDCANYIFCRGHRVALAGFSRSR